MASFILSLHLLWILWVVFGALFTRRRTLLAGLHVGSLLWGIIVEVSSLPCPLTLTEQYFEQQAGSEAYRGGFIQHWLDRLVYPDVPASLLVSLGVAVCAANLAVYAYRFAKQGS